MAYVRTVKTASGATAVQIVWSSLKGSRRSSISVQCTTTRSWWPSKRPRPNAWRLVNSPWICLDQAGNGDGPLEVVARAADTYGRRCAMATAC